MFQYSTSSKWYESMLLGLILEKSAEMDKKHGPHCQRTSVSAMMCHTLFIWNGSDNDCFPADSESFSLKQADSHPFNYETVTRV